VEGAPLEAQLTASIAAVKAAKEAPVPPPAPPAAMTRTAAVTAGMDQVCDAMQHCLTRALNMICAAQKSAIEQGCAINFLGADVQDLASTIYIQLGRTAEQNARNQNGTLRANGGASPWAH
jgi:hypothetical protein